MIIASNIKVLEFSKEALSLAKEYRQKGAIPKSEPEDAYHIGIASVNEIECLASWNFKHIVSINPIRKIHEINSKSKSKYSTMEIGSLEMFGGAKYGNL